MNLTLKFYENSEIYKTNLKFHLTSQGKCKKMDRRQRKDGKGSRGGRERYWR